MRILELLCSSSITRCPLFLIDAYTPTRNAKSTPQQLV